MRKKFGTREYDKEPQSAGIWTEASEPPKGSKKRKEIDGIIPEGLPDRFFNAEGDIDLRQVTGEDAWKFFAAQGIKLPVMPRSDGR